MIRRKSGSKHISQIILCICVFSCTNLLGQSKYNTVEDDLISSFNNKLTPQTRLYNGVSYTGYFGKLEGNAYLDDNATFVNGSVTYDGFEFKNVPILVDLVAEKLVSLSSDGYNWYSLLNDRLSGFIINDRRFLSISSDTSENATIRKGGFFEISYEGKMQVLIKRTKSIKEVVEQYGVTKIFYQKNEYFISKEKQFYKINREADILRLFANRKLELKKYLRSQNLKFRDNPNTTLVALVSYYEENFK